jgi:hypothetical protein
LMPRVVVTVITVVRDLGECDEPHFDVAHEVTIPLR